MPPLVDTPTTANLAATGTSHIPAWRRIGLKLKYAADTPNPTATTTTTTTTPTPTPVTAPSKKRKHDENDGDAPASETEKTKRKSKKQKPLEDDKKSMKEQQPKASTPPPPVSAARSLSPAKSLLKKTKDVSPHRKSVSFAADVKATDGDSIKQLYLALDPFGKNRTRGGVTPAVNHTPASPPKEKTPSPQPKKKAIVPLRPKHRGGSNNNGSTKHYLDYLSNFHLHRALWKFEKAKQNWILKCALNSELIPETHEEALAVYVAGLQGAGCMFNSATRPYCQCDERLKFSSRWLSLT